MTLIRVSEVMSRNPIKVESSLSAEEGARIMSNKGISSLLIEEGEKIIGMDESKYLMYYYKFFNTVEIDSTYYSFPGEKTINSWISKVQGKEDFLYSLKFPKEVTHDPDGITEKSIQTARDFVSKVILPIKNSGMFGSALLQMSPFLDPMKNGT